MFTAREPFSAGDLRMSLFKKPSLSGLVRESPFVPIQEHMRTVFPASASSPPLFDALYRKDLAQVHDFAAQIDQLETEADRIKTNFRLNTPKSLFLPVDREDLLDLIAVQDHLADTVEEIGQILCYRDMEVPEALKEVLDELLEGTMEISSEAKAIIEQLDELLEVGFNGLEVDKGLGDDLRPGVATSTISTRSCTGCAGPCSRRRRSSTRYRDVLVQAHRSPRQHLRSSGKHRRPPAALSFQIGTGIPMEISEWKGAAEASPAIIFVITSKSPILNISSPSVEFLRDMACSWHRLLFGSYGNCAAGTSRVSIKSRILQPSAAMTYKSAVWP